MSELTKVDQTGNNSFAAVLATLTGFPIAKFAYVTNPMANNSEGWVKTLNNLINECGCRWVSLRGHLTTNDYYIVVGTTSRSDDLHVCIYQNGQLWHDPHSDRSGLTTEVQFHALISE